MTRDKGIWRPAHLLSSLNACTCVSCSKCIPHEAFPHRLHTDGTPTLNAVMNSLSAAPSSSSMCTRLRLTSSQAASNESAAGTAGGGFLGTTMQSTCPKF